jgi:predicted TIM-barrel fold metal-dependent hydrolase
MIVVQPAKMIVAAHFWETVEKLGMPIYIHPRVPPKGMSDLLGYRALGDAMWGYMADASLHAMRLMCGGVFDAYPKLKIILGHLGEGIPFWLWRMDNRWARGKANTPKRRPGEYFNDNFHVTTSGMFGEEAFACVYRILGAEKILFAVDYPYESNEEAVKFIEEAKIPDSDREKICHSNAEKLFAL